MIKHSHRKSVKWSLITLLSTLLIGAAGLTSACTVKTASDTDTLSESGEADSTTPSTAPSLADNGNTAAAVTPVISNDSGGQSSLTAYIDKNKYNFQSLKFIDAAHGWVIKNEFTDIDGILKSYVVRTQDGGAHWNSYEVKDAVLEQLEFTDAANGWAVARSGNTADNGLDKADYEILVTRDGGESWMSQLTQTASAGDIYDIGFTDSLHGCAIIGGKLFVTSDGGSNWSVSEFPADGFTAQHLSFTDADTGWVIGTTVGDTRQNTDDAASEYTLRVFSTTDGGRSFQQQFSRSYEDGPVNSIDICFVDAKTGWFLISDLAAWQGDLYHTSDAGITWEQLSQIKCTRPIPMKLDFINEQEGWIPLNVGAGPISGGFMHTEDGGKSFTYIGNDNEVYSANDVDFLSAQEGWAIGMNLSYGDYLLHTTDGGSNWSQVYPAVSPTIDISFVDNLNGYGIGQLSSLKTLLYSGDGGSTWEHIYTFQDDRIPEKISFIDRNNGWVLAANAGGSVRLLKTADGGYTWQDLGVSLSITSINTAYFHFMDSNNGIAVSSNMPAYYRTSDGGLSWQVTSGASSGVNNYQYSFISPGTGWEVLQTYQEKYSVEIKGLSAASSWQSLSNLGDKVWSYGIYFISKSKGWMLTAEAPFQPDSMYKLLSTGDGGKTWTYNELPAGIKIDTYGSQIPMQFTDELHGFILANLGLLKTADGGKTWYWAN